MNITNFDLKPYNGRLIGFSSRQVPIKGTIRLRLTLGTWSMVFNINMDFLMLDALNNAYMLYWVEHLE